MDKKSLRNSKVPLQALTKESILSVLGQILEYSLDSSLRRIIIEPERGHVRIESYVAAGDTDHSPYGFVRQKVLAEYVLEEGPPHEELFKIFDQIRQEEFEVTHILCGGTAFNSWIRLPKKARSVFGTPILVSPELPADVFIVCGASDREASIEDVEYSLKVTLP